MWPYSPGPICPRPVHMRLGHCQERGSSAHPSGEGSGSQDSRPGCLQGALGWVTLDCQPLVSRSPSGESWCWVWTLSWMYTGGQTQGSVYPVVQPLTPLTQLQMCAVVTALALTERQ